MPEANNANARQVGGNHYKTAYEHWDWVEDNGVGYLGGCATKYLSRWRQKNGLQDLEKADHYVQKMIERKTASLFGSQPNYFAGTAKLNDGLVEFARVNGLTAQEFEAVSLIAQRRSIEDLERARTVIQSIMMQAA